MVARFAELQDAALIRTRQHDKAPRSTTKHYKPMTTPDNKFALRGKYSKARPTKYGKPCRNRHHTKNYKGLQSTVKTTSRHTLPYDKKILQGVYKVPRRTAINAPRCNKLPGHIKKCDTVPSSATKYQPVLQRTMLSPRSSCRTRYCRVL